MEKSKIEWCDSTWNPVSGCYHPCPYCYARSTANRFKGCDCAAGGETDENVVYLKERLTVTSKDGVVRNAAYPFGFTPTFHEYRLNDPLTKGFGKTIFVCSMADLFGDWVPDEWIKKVFDACKAASGHRYLFLTKNPARYIRLYEAACCLPATSSGMAQRRPSVMCRCSGRTNTTPLPVSSRFWGRWATRRRTS